ncbi:MAG: quinoprotein dehydrogenase-associated putative ABC transporter substrate-binding protein [Chromatiales bacterium]
MKYDSAASRCFPVKLVLLLGGLLGADAVGGQEPVTHAAFRVCADPYSLPSSDKDQQGFENKIAQLFAGDLKLPLEYTWFPQRIGFIRNTLRSNDAADGRYKCDIVMGVPTNFELAATTKPYYRSTWAMVYVKGRGWDDVKSQEDLVKLPVERKKALRIGLFDRSPAALWLIKNDMMENIIPYQIMSGDARAYPGEIIEKDLVGDEINLTFVWGPIAGYFAKQVRSPEIAVIPMRSEPGIRFDFSIAMAVRFGEKDWKQQIQALIDKHRERIRAILAEYGVPLLED